MFTETEQAAAPLEAPPALGLDSAEPADDAALEAVAARRWRVALGLTGAMLVVYFGFILLIAFAKGFLASAITDGLSVGMALGVARDPRDLGADLDLRALGEPRLRARARAAEEVGHADRGVRPGRGRTRVAIVFFLVFVAIALGITWWAARRTRTTEQFYAAGRSVTGFQNGLALAGDYMSAASFLGIAGLVALTGFDGLIYSIGLLVGWPIVLFLIAEPLRNLGKYTFADVVAYRMRQTPVRLAAAVGTLSVVTFYLIAQMVGAGTLINLIFGLAVRRRRS